jgi:glycosyltransferase involved in cell wall biosynthesis
MRTLFPAMPIPELPANLSGCTILQVIPELDTGGAEATTLEVAEAILAAGGKALVASQGGAMARQLTAMGAQLIELPVASKNPWTMWRNVGRLARLMKLEGVDIVHARSRAPAWSCLFAARRAGALYMATYHGLVHPRPASKVFYNSVLTRGVAVIANSSYTAQLISDVHGVGSDQIKVVPRGCNVETLARGKITPSQIAEKRAQWGVSGDDFVVLCPARLTPIKGQDVLIKAFGALQAELEGAPARKLVLVGSAQGRDDYAQHLQNLAAQYGVLDDVVFAGLETNMAAAYAASDAACVPSTRAEPFGRTIIEAQAGSLPVIASDAGGFRETVLPQSVENGGSGWLVTPGDVSALHHALRELVDMSPAARAQIGENGRAYCTTHFTQTALCARTLSVYQQVAASKS